MRFRNVVSWCLLGLVVGTLPALALQPRQRPSRFDHLARVAPNSGLSSSAVSSDALDPALPAAAGWRAFVEEQRGGWRGHFDARSGLPMLVQGRGIAWVKGRGNALSAAPSLGLLESLARAFVAGHPALLGRWDGQLVLDRDASGKLSDDVWQVTFRQVVNGVPVDGARLNFQVAHGNLVAFGATQWAPVTRGTAPALSVNEARAALDATLGVGPGELSETAPATLVLLPRDPRGQRTAGWNGPAGTGYAHDLAWRFNFVEPGHPATWIAHVDADTGAVIALEDDTKYDSIKGGVYPTSDDGNCPDGCVQPNFPLPFSYYTENGGPQQTTGGHGQYACSAVGSSINTQLTGPYILVSDSCGQANESTTCENPLDLSQSGGTDCTVPAGHSAGDTHAGRSSFYHLNRAMERGRAWLPENTWLKSQVTDNINIFSTCNAFWSGSVNFYRSGGGCRNTGEIAGVFVHEWGHGIDQNDGGGYDNPSEAYADTVAFLETRVSCVGRGFYMSQNCDGYGDACLNCTGIRDQDWDMHVGHQPATASWVSSHCGGGGGPCGGEAHCEAYISAETVWDLAARDLPAMGFDTASAWQHTEQLFYLSRKGSGGSAYNCSGSTSDGCNTDSWFNKFRVADDDDGNLANGTPHAAAIFAAFKRHGIACGNVSDASNQNHSSCPTLAKPSITVAAGSNANTVNWAPVSGANSYRVLRNDFSCDRSQIIVGTANAPATSFVDQPVANGFPVYYRVQAVGSTAACVSPVSDCLSVAAQPFAGAVHFDHATYGCSAQISLSVTDANVGGPTTTVAVWSASEPTPETVTLTQIAPGSAKYVGSIPATSGPAVHGDGLLSIKHNDPIDAQYIDADDGIGGINVPRTDHATGDCIYPVISGVGDTNTTDKAATVTWTTDEVSDSVLVWGTAKPPATTTSNPALTTGHAIPLAGLQSCTVYWYEVHSTDAAGNVAVSDNGGQYFHFETQGIFGGVMQPCHQGRISVGKKTLACTDGVPVQLVDIDLNGNPLVAETIAVTVSSTKEPTPETLILTETGPNTSTFAGTAQVAQGNPVAGDGIVQIGNGDTFTVTYRDGNDGTGQPRVSYDTAVDDCAGAGFNPVRVINVTDDGAQISFTTSEPTTGRVEWGLTAALGQSVSDSNLSTSHAIAIGPLAECGRVYFRVFSTDAYGNVSSIDRAGQPFEFNAGIIPGIFRDGFETTTGWTLAGEWQIGTPQGKGSGNPDPTAAFAGTKVLGEDLTGLGTKPGDYEPHVDERVVSPVINATALTGGQLKFRRWLNQGVGSIAYVEVKQGTAWKTVFTHNQTPADPINDTSWVLQTVDISQYADHNGSLQIAFRLWAGPGSTNNASGWNIDRFVIHSGGTPDFDSCGSCGGAPTFGGLTAVVDNDACANNGVTISWKEAPSWGTGHPGTFTVYRDTVPNFTPSASNRVAHGVTGTAYNDATAPDGATLYYLVRAENDETCSSGAHNNGMTDSNTVYGSVATTSSRAVPGALGTLAVNRVNFANLRLSWAPLANTNSYRVYRSISPLPGNFGKINETGLTLADDTGAGSNQATYFYLVRGANACGTEGP